MIAAGATREEKRTFLLSDFHSASTALSIGSVMVIIGYFIDDFGGKVAFAAGLCALGFAMVKIMTGISKLATVTR